MLRMFVQQQVVHREFWLVLLLNAVLPVVVPLLAWIALAQSVDALQIEGWNIATFTQYYIINFIVYSLSFTSIHSEMGNLVRTGQLNFWILRPLNFFGLSFSFSLARFAVMLVFCTFVGVLVQLTGIAEFSREQQLFALMVLPFSVILLMLLNMCIGMLAFWLIECDGAFAAILLFLQFFGGLILPLDLFPTWLQPISTILPLRYAFGLPSEAVVTLAYHDIPQILFGQIVWIGIFFFATSILWRRGLRHYDAVGA